MLHPAPPGQRQTKVRKRRGYTLIEVLIAMVIFAVITAATSFAVTVALKSQQGIRLRTDELQEARSVLNVLTRDLRAAYASAGNQNTLFLAGGNESGTLLTFSTLSHKINDPSRNSSTGQTGQTGQPDQTQTAQPQSDIGIVQYSFDPQTGQLSRLETAVPNPDTLPQAGGPETGLSKHVRSVSFQFLVDPSTGFRQDWNYVTQPPSTGASSGTGGQNNTQAAVQATGDTTLPQSVQIQIEFVNGEGISRQYSTVVMLA